MLHVLLILLGVIVGLWLTLSTLVLIYWSLKGDPRLNRESKLMYCVWIGTLVGLGFFFTAGFYEALFFIPDSWGGLNEDIEWVNARLWWASVLGTLTSFFTMWIFHHVATLVRETESLRRQCDHMESEKHPRTSN